MENKVSTEEQRIEDEAKDFAEKAFKGYGKLYKMNNPVVFDYSHSGYIAGATKEAERARELVRALDLAYAYLHSGISINPHSGIHNTIEKALQDYNQNSQAT